MSDALTCAKAPCKSCPYRQDVPSGVWHEDEYAKLPKYDGDIIDQLTQGGEGLFMCHQGTGELCAGWLATHGAENLLALRLASEEIAAEVWTYRSPVPVFESGQEAADHGMKEIRKPGDKAERVIERLLRTVPGVRGVVDGR